MPATPVFFFFHLHWIKKVLDDYVLINGWYNNLPVSFLSASLPLLSIIRMALVLFWDVSEEVHYYVFKFMAKLSMLGWEECKLDYLFGMNARWTMFFHLKSSAWLLWRKSWWTTSDVRPQALPCNWLRTTSFMFSSGVQQLRFFVWFFVCVHCTNNKKTLSADSFNFSFCDSAFALCNSKKCTCIFWKNPRSQCGIISCNM